MSAVEVAGTLLTVASVYYQHAVGCVGVHGCVCHHLQVFRASDMHGWRLCKLVMVDDHAAVVHCGLWVGSAVPGCATMTCPSSKCSPVATVTEGCLGHNCNI
jgi:hypothetical protein